MGVLLTVSYDGTNYCGWQEQKNGKSVQEALSKVIGMVFDSDFTMLGASRTDAGVHALGQRAHVIPKRPVKIPIGKIPLVLNNDLPPDIRVTDAIDVPDNFHPINNAISKTYRYTICNSRYHSPLLRNYSAHIPIPLDTFKMADAARHFIGKHDFAAFCASGSIVKSTIRTIYALDVAKNGDIVEITISGGGFLYNMVRIIAGTLA
ncbi:MAG: tRNA pseudouridine(38-40) synthase TruA, partial [Clostridiales bacterium]|nr:tRNA pseudouridine(38-40) synthase TruA [Clostridiales bacterium]